MSKDQNKRSSKGNMKKPLLTAKEKKKAKREKKLNKNNPGLLDT